MAEAEDRLDAALRIIEDYPNLHMGPFQRGGSVARRYVARQVQDNDQQRKSDRDDAGHVNPGWCSAGVEIWRGTRT